MNGEVVRNATVGTLVAATLISGVVMLLPHDGHEPAAMPGSAARARTAAGAGAPASLSDLNALIADREHWLRSHPRDEVSWAELGAAYTERSARRAEWTGLPRAEKALRRSLALLPGEKGNSEALLGLAELANVRRDFLAARGFAQQAQKQAPRRWAVYRALIDAYSGLGDYKSATAALARLQSLYEGSRARAVSARVYRDRGWREDAAATAYDAVGTAQGPAERAAALWRLGELSWERGEYEEAVDACDAAIALAPEDYGALVVRARALAALDRKDEALRDYRRALAKLPLPEYALEAAELYESLGLREDSKKAYGLMRTAAGQASAQGVNQELLLGRYEADHGDPEKAVRRLSALWDRGLRSAQLADALGWALLKADRADEALPYAQRATETGPRSALLAYHRGTIERALGMHGAARRHIGEALRINPRFSPLLVPTAQKALASLGEPPVDVSGGTA
jgi:tetratricopeptide (TPR) repeat protein